MVSTVDGNHALMKSWLDKWEPLANDAIKAYCDSLGVDGAAEAAISATRDFYKELGFVD
jgi:toluene monooxygenase system protein E